ncbi:MAG: SDR family NAD(P)-dependent oxidoreductase [Variovorax sp.]
MNASTTASTSIHLSILTGASRGMGRAVALQLLQPNRLLLCISRHADAALAPRADAAGTELVQWQQDLGDTQAAAARLAEWLEALDGKRFASATLINNAGVLAAPRPLAGADPGELSNALRVGLEAPMQLTAVFLRATSDWQAERKVLNISSGLGRNAMASQAPYCAAKAGMDHFTRVVALEQAASPSGAKIVSLAPGVIDTDMQQQLRDGDAKHFPDRERFARLKRDGQLDSPDVAAGKVLAYLARADFGSQPIADVRDA